MKAFLAASLILTASPSLAKSPIAEVLCETRDAMVQRLEGTFGAERLGRGVRGPDAVMEIWTVPSTGDWTMVQSYSSGMSCIVAMGEHWDDFAKPVDPPA